MGTKPAAGGGMMSWATALARLQHTHKASIVKMLTFTAHVLAGIVWSGE